NPALFRESISVQHTWDCRAPARQLGYLNHRWSSWCSTVPGWLARCCLNHRGRMALGPLSAHLGLSSTSSTTRLSEPPLVELVLDRPRLACSVLSESPGPGGTRPSSGKVSQFSTFSTMV